MPKGEQKGNKEAKKPKSDKAKNSCLRVQEVAGQGRAFGERSGQEGLARRDKQRKAGFSRRSLRVQAPSSDWRERRVGHYNDPFGLKTDCRPT